MIREYDEIINQVLNFYNNFKNEQKNSRHKSWEYCYKIFNEAHNCDKVDDKYIDYLCLNLAFYLASWGMYRASSFLLKKDYKIHKSIVKEILLEKYKPLWNIKVDDYNENNLTLLMTLATNLRKYYDEIREEVKEVENKDIPKEKVSDTLITKVLMGTLGCVPAYDKYFTFGIKKLTVAHGNFSENSMQELIKFYKEYENKFEKIRKQMKVDNSNLEYPQMKILDMCFWLYGIQTK